jgi:hypothetical protein
LSPVVRCAAAWEEEGSVVWLRSVDVWLRLRFRFRTDFFSKVVAPEMKYRLGLVQYATAQYLVRMFLVFKLKNDAAFDDSISYKDIQRFIVCFPMEAPWQQKITDQRCFMMLKRRIQLQLWNGIILTQSTQLEILRYQIPTY